MIDVGPARNSRIWFLKTTALFGDTTESVVSWASQVSRHREFEKGALIDLEGSCGPLISLIQHGQVKLRTMTASGKERILDVLGPEDTFGSLEQLVADPAKAAHGASGEGLTPLPLAAFASEAVAMTPVSLLQLPASEFHEILAKRPLVILNISRILGLRQRRLEIRLARLLYRSSLGKVAGVVSELAERFGEPTPDGTGINIQVRLTHQEIASLIGVKRETVSEALAQLELDGYLKSTRQSLVVLKPQELDQVV